MKAGFANVSIKPPFPTSMAGYVTRKPRIFSEVRDEPRARAIALSEDNHGVVVVAADFLTPQEKITDAFRRFAAEHLPEGVHLVLHAQHTHSAPGNYWDHPVARWFCGPYRPEVFEFLARRFAEAAVKAWQARDHARVAFHAERLAGLQENRRRADGPIDETLTLLTFTGEDGRPLGAIVQYPGHPVIVAEREFHAMSADYPGRVAAALEERYPTTLFLNGAVGGLSIWFPKEPLPVGEHFARVVDPIVAAAHRMGDAMGAPERGRIAFSRESLTLPKAGAKPFPPGYKATAPLYWPLVKIWDRVVQSGFPVPRVTSVSGLRICGAALVFQPSDYGVGAGLVTRERGRELGLAACVVGHSDDYCGYIHPESEMLIAPSREGEYAGMTIYENTMGFHGRGAWDAFAGAEHAVLTSLAGAF
ncbi:hypothetical protein K8I61_06030 [bacterium]|nr:hypothetical protein [bacterium]